jgi:hypothetical protein
MTRGWTSIALFASVALLLAGCGSSQATSTPSPATAPASALATAPGASQGLDPSSIGRAYIEALARGDWAGAAAMEDPVMASAAGAAQLQQITAALVTQYGAYQSIGNVTTTTQGSYTVVAVIVTFASAKVTLNVSLDAAGQVAGFHVGAVAVASSSPAPYVNPSSFTETDVTVGSSPWTLPGTLTMPNGSGPFPAVVLVAGSGPSDRDETFGPNKPLRDLAWGLASSGIAALRYDKRTLVYGAQMATDSSLTVRQETTDDAEAAVTLLRTTSMVDPARVFLVGHSLGAYLAPRMAAEIPGQLDGIVLLEAPSTPIPQLMLIQTRYLTSLQGASPSPEAEQQLAALEQQVALAESPSLSPSTPSSELPGGVPASYWLDLQTYHPVTVAAGLNVPMFFSQGTRDYQVPPSELEPWQQALAGHSNVTFKTYPAMDHLLLDGSGPATPAEYSTPAHVDRQLVADLVAWITGH